MFPVLPSRPNLRHLRTQARDLRKACRSGESDACSRVASSYPRSAETSDEVSLSDAQLVIAREYGFDSWAKLKRTVEGEPMLAIYSSEPSFYETYVQNSVYVLEETDECD